MREVGGKEYFEALMEAFETQREDHIAVYGPDNHMRLTGKHETASIHEFSYGIADRGASIRVPHSFANNGYKGYLEDRRPNSQGDPYQIASQILKTIASVPTDQERRGVRLGNWCEFDPGADCGVRAGAFFCDRARMRSIHPASPARIFAATGSEFRGRRDRSAREAARRCRPAGQYVKVKVEYDLSAGAFVELLHRNAFRSEAALAASATLLHRGHEAREVCAEISRIFRAGTLGMTSVWPSARGMMSMKASDASSS